MTGLIPVLPVHPARDAAMEAASTGHRVGMSAAVSLRLPARPENVAVVRQALTGLGDAYDLDPELLGDIKTAVTEACNNVVLHAYPDEDGIVEVEADSDGEHTDVVVRDFGAGIQPRSITEERTLGSGCR